MMESSILMNATDDNLSDSESEFEGTIIRLPSEMDLSSLSEKSFSPVKSSLNINISSSKISDLTPKKNQQIKNSTKAEKKKKNLKKSKKKRKKSYNVHKSNSFSNNLFKLNNKPLFRKFNSHKTNSPYYKNIENENCLNNQNKYKISNFHLDNNINLDNINEIMNNKVDNCNDNVSEFKGRKFRKPINYYITINFLSRYFVIDHDFIDYCDFIQYCDFLKLIVILGTLL
ncbi:hypothetical protein M0813_17852 [Anaeramoeba flamelloides]|uniref:Uncharacterized protein n=1 Tax=Anaeramoeba flamelloides TaxID=1746091 RepID=A0ABQ8YUG3_9EUKA|nr:hypothetical protein M0813_17852 [Anaeramoeba flamelloides]